MKFILPDIVRVYWSGIILPPCLKLADYIMGCMRKELLKNIKGRVLDVGTGTGKYFKYYKDQKS